ncbi:NAD(P)-dependent oxidoreductase [Fictibacillus iocasae]|uniref:NAD(P)-dependent oxidoreductase n=1 Tax=Fictibacillus iocasae TaxID=2715437 RepID=A0ABW2NR54_9BACL
MNLCVLGATGRTGLHILKLAAADGHSVSALLRDSSKLPVELAGHIRTVIGSARSKGDLLSAMDGCDAVVSALSTDGGDLLSEATPLIIEAMKETNISRIITIGTAGILNSRTEPHLLRYESSESRRKLTRAASEHRTAYEMLQRSDLDWTIVCPTYLPDGPVTANYRVEADRLPVDGTSISTGDTAHFAYTCLKDELFVGRRAGVAY